MKTCFSLDPRSKYAKLSFYVKQLLRTHFRRKILKNYTFFHTKDYLLWKPPGELEVEALACVVHIWYSQSLYQIAITNFQITPTRHITVGFSYG